MAVEVGCAITLRGSADIIAEFFDYGINSILYQRGIYPPESFTRAQKYGLSILVTTDKSLKDFISNVLKQLQEWLMTKEVHRLVLVIANVETKETLERWEFKIECENANSNKGTKQKDIKEIQREIRDVIRQITASVTFLPLLDNECSFDVLLYTSKNSEVPNDWAETSACQIANSQEVCLRSFSTSVHKVDTSVFYKNTNS